MKKNIKYSVSLVVIVFSLMLSCVVYAEDNIASVNVNTNNTLGGQNIKERIQINNEENKVKLDEFKKQVKDIREEKRIQLEKTIQSIKDKRADFKTQFEDIKDQAKSKIAEMKNVFKANLSNIKDENKKISAEKIIDIIQTLNTKTTDNLSNKIDQIENVLVSIESRISKAESNGLDVSSVKTEVEKAKTAITQARAAVSIQASKVYNVNVTTESTLRDQMKTLRDTFSKDIKAVHEVVKSAREAVKNTAVTLAKIPKINEIEVSASVENNNTNNNQ